MYLVVVYIRLPPEKQNKIKEIIKSVDKTQLIIYNKSIENEGRFKNEYVSVGK